MTLIAKRDPRTHHLESHQSSLVCIAHLPVLSIDIHVSLYRDRGLNTLPSRALVSILILIIAVSSTVLSLGYAQLVNAFREGFIRNPDVPFPERWRRVVQMNNVLQNPIFWIEGFGGFVVRPHSREISSFT